MQDGFTNLDDIKKFMDELYDIKSGKLIDGEDSDLVTVHAEDVMQLTRYCLWLMVKLEETRRDLLEIVKKIEKE